MQFFTEQYFFKKKKNKDRLIQDYNFISILYFQFLVWTKNMKKKLIQDFFRHQIIHFIWRSPVLIFSSWFWFTPETENIGWK